MNVEDLVKDIDNFDIESCINSILQSQCILFLGPNFSMDQNGKKIHKLIKSRLESEFKDKLDFSYDNLYIFKDPKTRSMQKMKLNIDIKNIYKSIQPNKIYDKIAAIPFSAVIHCSPDKYLTDSHQRLGFEYNFQYYSHKGVSKSKAEIINKATFIYNVFGDVEVGDSLINTYDGFYKFVISILGEEQVLPPALTEQIADASMFIFLGFDLTKWYIPLIVHKLHGFIQDPPQTGITAVLNKDNTYDSFTPKILPIDIAKSNDDSLIIMETIYNHLESLESLKKVTRNTDTGNSLDYEEISELIAHNRIEEGISRLREAYNKRGLEREQLDAVSAHFEEYQDNITYRILSQDQASIEKNKIVRSLIQVIKRIK